MTTTAVPATRERTGEPSSGADRTARVDAAARALYEWHCRRAGRTALPNDFDSLGPHTREWLEIGAIRVLQAGGAL